MPLTHLSHSPTQHTTMLERVLSSRRATPHGDEASSNDDGGPADDSKTKKHLAISLFLNRVTNYVTRFGPVWPCLLALLIVLVLIFSLIFNSRSFVCVSPYHQVSRSGFFGFDGLESDFGLLGVPWCKIFVISVVSAFFFVLPIVYWIYGWILSWAFLSYNHCALADKSKDVVDKLYSELSND